MILNTEILMFPRMEIRSRTGALRTAGSSCGPTALFNLCDRSEEEVLKTCTDHGYSQKSGMFTHEILKAAKDIGLEPEKIKLTWNKRYTVHQIQKSHPYGAYLLFVYGHVLAMVNGNIVDTNSSTIGLKRRVTMLVKVTSQSTSQIQQVAEAGSSLTMDDRVEFRSLWWKHVHRGTDNYNRFYQIQSACSFEKSRGNRGALVKDIITTTNGFVSRTFIRNQVKRNILQKV